MLRRAAPAVVVALDLAGLAMLHGVSDAPWARLSTAAPPEDAVVAVVRLVALALGWWLAGSVVVYGLARVAGAARLAGSVGRLALPAARRLVDGALLATLTLGPALPAGAARALPPPLLVQQVAEDAGASGRSAPVLPPVVAPPRHAPPPAPPPPPAGPAAVPQPPPAAMAPDTARHHVVAPGEHLWAIADRAVGTAGSPDDVARYWRRLVDANRDRLRSADPDLIHPGEVLVLPPLEDLRR